MNNVKLIKKNNLLQNLNVYKAKKVCAMIKANAYGHGIKEIVGILDGRVDYFGVANAEEGRFARKHTKTPILVVGKTEDFEKCKANNLEIMVESVEDVKRAVGHGLKDNLHLKINCGMNRYGVSESGGLKKICQLLKEYDVGLKSVCTHFSNTDDREQTLCQYKRFLELKQGIENIQVCLGGSGVIDYDFDYDMIRVGIGLYGYERAGLLPVMEIRSKVLKVVFVKQGEYVGYGKKYRATTDGFYAVVPVGYADGLKRCLSGKFSVFIDGKRYKSVGNICMDVFFVRVDSKVKIGSEVVVANDMASLAKKANTISYEVLTGFSNLRGKTKIV